MGLVLSTGSLIRITLNIKLCSKEERNAWGRFLRVSVGHDHRHRAVVFHGLARECHVINNRDCYLILQLITLDKLKNDYRNPVDFANNQNMVSFNNYIATPNYSSHFQLVLPEYSLHLFIAVLLFLFGYWITFIWNVPLVAYHLWRSVYI